MVAPIDYTAQVGDPFAQALQGYKIGAGIAQAEQERADLERQQLAQKQYQQAITRLMSPDATAKDYENVMLISNKDQAENIRKVMESRDARANQATLRQMGNVALSLATGNTDVGVNFLKREAEAARNSGDQMEANYLEQMAEQAKKDPKNVAMLWGGKMTLIPGGKDYLDNVLKAAKGQSEIGKAEGEAKEAQAKGAYAEKQQIADLEKKAADLGLTKAQTGSALASTKKLGVETARAALELEALKATGGVDPEKTFAQEEKIRKEWQGRNKLYSELKGTYSNIESSSVAGTGAGDIALITSFMKMLDPGSVVRETEFATARDTAGLFTQLENRLQKAKDGQLLKPEQRKQYVDLAKKYLDAAQKKSEQEKKDLGIVVKNYRLNPQNVFGAEPAPAKPLPSSATVNGQTYQRPANFTDEQWRGYLMANGVIQ